MSDETKPENERPTLPPMTANDWQILIQSIVALVTMGVTVIEVHPARWLLLVDAALRFGGPMVEPVRNARGEVAGIPLGFMLHDKPIRALLKRWDRCPNDPCESCDAILAQGANYPVPEEEPRVILPGGRGGRLLS